MKRIKSLIVFIVLIFIIKQACTFFFPFVASNIIDYIPDNLLDNKYVDSIKSNSMFTETIIYNGTKIEDAIKSNDEIDNKARSLTKDCKTEREKAKILYSWIGSNIEYDNDKAAIVLQKDITKDMPKSGAIIAFDSRSGICFDKASLYVAMARAVGLKVRLISGEAYDGEQYIGHAWNEVYLNDEDTWINVDTTFYDGGNYFDSNLFSEHKADDIAGEW